MRAPTFIAFVTVAAALSLSHTAHAAPSPKPPLLPSRIVETIASHLSGEAAKRDLELIAREHRMRGSRGFHTAALHIVEALQKAGLTDAHIERLPADGEIMYGSQRSRPAWDADFAELWEMERDDDVLAPTKRLASWDAAPITLAEDSESADVTTRLIDVGAGVEESDYKGKDVRGAIVLASSQPGAVARLAVDRFGAVGIVSYAQNQRTAWWGEDENLIRWGHLGSLSPTKTFAFMVSPKQARSFSHRLENGEHIMLHATVRAGRHAGYYDIVTATIPGADPQLRDEEIAFSCHLDHQRPGANDNASGAVAILEVARTLSTLINNGQLARPARTIRFIWPPEIEGTIAFLNADAERAARIKAAIHMDMVGGAPVTKAIFHITRGPTSVPSFINDVAESFGGFLNRETIRYASGEPSNFPLVAPEGGKEPLQAELAEFTMGSDHQVYADSSFSTPIIYMNDWPDRYIHTNRDSAANIDPTKLRRAAFLGALDGYFLAGVTQRDAPAIFDIIRERSLTRAATTLRRRRDQSPDEAAVLTRHRLEFERAIIESMRRFFEIPDEVRARADAHLAALRNILGDPGAAAAATGAGALVFRRSDDPRGPLSVFGYDYLADHFGAEQTRKLLLLHHQGLRGDGGAYAYEALNFVNSRRTARDIRDELSAEFGPISLDKVVQFLRALESIHVIEQVTQHGARQSP